MDVRYDGNGGIHGRSSGREAVAAHERIMLAAMRNSMVMKIALYGLAAFLVIGCAVLIVFAPAGRTVAVNIVSVALLTIAAGAAGFATFKVKAPGIYASASRMMPRTEDDGPGWDDGRVHVGASISDRE
jgi:hypothetical protein